MASKALKSTFTFKLVPGDTFEWEIEIFYFNFKSKDLEPLSSSPQTTPKHLKIPFGFLDSVTFVDSQLLSVVNSKGNTALLQFERLSPLLVSEDSKLKRALIHFKEQGCEKVVKTLNQLLKKFHADEQRVEVESSCGGSSSCGGTGSGGVAGSCGGTGSGGGAGSCGGTGSSGVAGSSGGTGSCIGLTKGRSPTESSKAADACSTTGRMSRSKSVSLLNENFEKHTYGKQKHEDQSQNGLAGKKRKRQNDSSDTEEETEDKAGKKNDIDRSVHDETDDDSDIVGKQAAKKENEVNSDSEETDNERGEVEIMQLVEEIIKKAKFLAVKFENIVIPNDIVIEQQKVNDYKEYLQKTPDKTKTSLLGLVRKLDEEGNMDGMLECWVNPELFLAHMELKLETEEYENRALAVVHTVSSEDEIDSRVLGNFLSANSKDFSVRFSDKLTYQDLLRFTIRTLEEEKNERTYKFVKHSLKMFSKGNRHCSLFIQFANLAPAFLKQFERFLKLYEEGSLNGMKLSTRKLCGLNRNFKRQDVTKLEVPIDILKNNMKVTEEARKEMLNSLLRKVVTFPQYKARLEDAVGLCEVKGLAAKISGQSYEELKARHPGQFEDKCLAEFIGAKSSPKTGPNQQLTKLTNRVREILSVPVEDLPDGLRGAVSFVKVDDLRMIATGKKVKEADVIFLQSVSDDNREVLDKFEYTIKEHVLVGNCVSVFAVSDPMGKDIKLNFLENLDIAVESVYIKSDKPEIVNGIKKEIIPLIIAGHKNLIKNSGLSNLFLSNLSEALPIILSSLVKVKGNVLSIFSDESGAVDVDPHGVLIRRGVSVCYVGLEESLERLKVRINKK